MYLVTSCTEQHCAFSKIFFDMWPAKMVVNLSLSSPVPHHSCEAKPSHITRQPSRLRSREYTYEFTSKMSGWKYNNADCFHCNCGDNEL